MLFPRVAVAHAGVSLLCAWMAGSQAGPDRRRRGLEIFCARRECAAALDLRSAVDRAGAQKARFDSTTRQGDARQRQEASMNDQGRKNPQGRGNGCRPWRRRPATWRPGRDAPWLCHPNCPPAFAAQRGRHSPPRPPELDEPEGEVQPLSHEQRAKILNDSLASVRDAGRQLRDLSLKLSLAEIYIRAALRQPRDDGRSREEGEPGA